jgi:hypothetical protein
MIAGVVPERIKDGICLEELQSIATVVEASHEHLHGALIVPYVCVEIATSCSVSTCELPLAICRFTRGRRMLRDVAAPNHNRSRSTHIRAFGCLHRWKPSLVGADAVEDCTGAAPGALTCLAN